MNHAYLKFLFQFLFFWGLAQSASALDDTLKVPEARFRVDKNIGLAIVHNPPNHSGAGPHRYIQLDSTYWLEEEVSQFETGKAYPIHSPNGRLFELYFSQLPIVEISVGDSIPNFYRIPARFEYAHPNGLAINQRVDIGIRGQSSRFFPKKSYRLEFKQDNGEDLDVQFPGMRSDGDWNLLAMYNEPFKVNNAFSHDLWLKMHALNYRQAEPEAVGGVRTQYLDLFIDGRYQGVYLLTERIDRKQLKLRRFNGNIRGELYKSIDWTGPTTFCHAHNFKDSLRVDGGLEYEYPESSETTQWVKISEFVQFVVSADSATYYQGIGNRFDLQNAADFFLYVNHLRACDNMGKNLYIAKYQQSAPYFFLPWDLDATLATDWAGNFEFKFNDLLSNGFYKRLLTDKRPNGFLHVLKNRHQTLKQGILSADSLRSEFSKRVNYLQSNGVYSREKRVHPESVADTSRLAEMDSWILNRNLFLDSLISQFQIESAIPFNTYCINSPYYPPFPPTPPVDTSSNPIDSGIVIVNPPVDSSLVVDPSDTIRQPAPPDDAQTDTTDWSVRYEASINSVVFSVPKDIKEEKVRIKTLRGRLLYSGHIGMEKSVVHLGPLPPGIYLVLLPGRSLRFMVYP